MLGQSHSRATCQPSTPVLAARAARREKLGEARSENRTFHCDPPSESAVFAMHAAVQTPKVVRQPAHHCELGLRPRGAQQRRLRGQNVPTPVRSAVFRSRSSGGAARDLSPWGPPVCGSINIQCELKEFSVRVVVTQLTIGFIQALVCMCGWAVRWLHANTSLMHAMHAMLRPVWGQSGPRSISYVAPKGAHRSRTRRSPRHSRIAELQPDWRNSSMISSPRCIISL